MVGFEFNCNLNPRLEILFRNVFCYGMWVNFLLQFHDRGQQFNKLKRN